MLSLRFNRNDPHDSVFLKKKKNHKKIINVTHYDSIIAVVVILFVALHLFSLYIKKTKQQLLYWTFKAFSNWNMLQLLKRLGWGLEEGGVTFRGGEVWFFSFQVFFESRVKNRETKERSTDWNYDIYPACETVGPLLTVCHVAPCWRHDWMVI